MPLTPTHFYGGTTGPWHVEELRAVCGDPLAPVERIAMQASIDPIPPGCRWWLRGLPSGDPQVNRAEREALRSHTPVLRRSESHCAALIPVRKTEAWWQLTQEERREILGHRTNHIQTWQRLLPAVARRVYRCRELGEEFDQLTWFEFAPCDRATFNDLVGEMRGSEEWQYVDREVDIRLRLLND